MDDTFDVIVIGSGLGGLTAGALLARGGRRVLVVERHDRLGGAATTFRRRHFAVEVGLHELDGLDTGDPKGPLWRALGLDVGLTTIQVPELYAIRHPLLAPEFVLPHGLEAARSALCARFPRHVRNLNRFLDHMTTLRQANGRFLGARRSPIWWLLNGPLFPLRFPAILRFFNTDLAGHLTHLFGDDEAVKLALAGNLGYFAEDPAQMSFSLFASAQASYMIGGGHYIQGGSQCLSQHLAGIIHQSGGTTRTRRVVTDILVENGRVVGVQHCRAKPIGRGDQTLDLSTRAISRAPIVIGNAAPNVLCEMLPKEMRRKFFKPFANRPTSPSLWTIYLGLNRPPSDFGVGCYSTFIYPSWVEKLSDYPIMSRLLGDDPGERVPGFVFVDYSRINARLAEDGYHLAVMCGMDWLDNWRKLEEDSYIKRKTAWLDRLLAELEKNFPGIHSALVFREMSTARTISNYLNTPGGAVYGWSQSVAHTGIFRPGPRTSVGGLFLASAFTFPGGGFTGAMLAGQEAARCVGGRAVENVLSSVQ